MSQDHHAFHDTALPIAAVERETGIAKDTLRVWEKRYGFPVPLREISRERLYPADQVQRLKLIRRLLDAGLRPGKIVSLSGDELQTLLQHTVDHKQRQQADAKQAGDNTVFDLTPLLQAIGSHDALVLRHGLNQAQMRMGLSAFLSDVVAPLITAVGEAWARGKFEVFEEHLFTEVLSSVLRNTIAAMSSTPRPRGPRVLLTTLPLEPHGLGLLMVEAVLTLEDCTCISLGTQTPIGDIVLAAQAHRVNIVGLSFTDIHHGANVLASLRELRVLLPAEIDIWAGGACTALYQKPLSGMTTARHLEQLPTLVEQWRANR